MYPMTVTINSDEEMRTTGAKLLALAQVAEAQPVPNEAAPAKKSKAAPAHSKATPPILPPNRPLPRRALLKTSSSRTCARHSWIWPSVTVMRPCGCWTRWADIPSCPRCRPRSSVWFSN